MQTATEKFPNNALLIARQSRALSRWANAEPTEDASTRPRPPKAINQKDARKEAVRTAELAAKADVSASTVNRFERGGAEPHSSTLRAIRQTFDAAGIEFIPGGARLREQAAEAQAS